MINTMYNGSLNAARLKNKMTNRLQLKDFILKSIPVMEHWLCLPASCSTYNFCGRHMIRRSCSIELSSKFCQAHSQPCWSLLWSWPRTLVHIWMALQYITFKLNKITIDQVIFFFPSLYWKIPCLLQFMCFWFCFFDLTVNVSKIIMNTFIIVNAAATCTARRTGPCQIRLAFHWPKANFREKGGDFSTGCVQGRNYCPVCFIFYH